MSWVFATYPFLIIVFVFLLGLAVFASLFKKLGFVLSLALFLFSGGYLLLLFFLGARLEEMLIHVAAIVLVSLIPIFVNAKRKGGNP